ncbi:hypothetical protein CYY_001355 [Polysphondylium violaceum]|uniref:Right handed beta helix domain-containing protein n=1 Tax=Polysphondylium violaceum TaxID=133409 RepID=A0A8J4Q3A0_9MYCE|nr:hypothetical protein CYY_001355 [Polysphondylium violaceum]
MNKLYLFVFSIILCTAIAQGAPCQVYVDPKSIITQKCGATSNMGCSSIKYAIETCTDQSNVVLMLLDGEHVAKDNFNMNYLNQTIVYQAVNPGKAIFNLRGITTPLVTITDTTAVNNGYNYITNFNMTGVQVMNANYQDGVTNIIQSNVNRTAITMYIDNCVFTANNATNGGVFLFNSSHTYGLSNIFITNSQFTYNTAYKGAVLYSEAYHNFYMRANTFTNNNGTYNALLYMMSPNQVMLQTSTFSKNYINRGGMVQIGISTEMPTIQSCTFDQNTGGGTKAAAVAYLMMNNAAVNLCNFTNNAGMGGILIVQVQYAQILNSYFYKNSYPSYGAGVYFEKSYVRIASSEFESNTASYGGAIAGYQDGTFTSTSSFTDLNITANVATVLGGGLYLNSNSVNMKNVDLQNNNGPNGTNLYCASSYLYPNLTTFGDPPSHVESDNAFGISCSPTSTCYITDAQDESVICGTYVPNKNKGLTGGQKAGIAIGVIGGVIIIIIVVVVVLRRIKRHQYDHIKY